MGGVAEAVLVTMAGLAIGCLLAVSNSLVKWLDARTYSEKLIHSQVKAGEEAITQFSGALHQIASKHKAKSGN